MRSSEIAIGAKVRVKKDMIPQLKEWEQSDIISNGVPRGTIVSSYKVALEQLKEESRKRRRKYLPSNQLPCFLWVDCVIAKQNGRMPLRVPMHYLELDK